MDTKRSKIPDMQMYTSRYSVIHTEKSTGGVRCHRHEIPVAYALHLHDYFEMEMVVEGELEQSVNGVSLCSRAGDFVFMDLMSTHRILAPQKPPTVWTLSISQSLADPSVTRLLTRKKLPLVGHLPKERLLDFQRIAGELAALESGDAPFAEERISALTILLLTMLLEHGEAPDNIPAEEPRAHHYIQRALLYINENYAEPLTLSDVAGQIHISACYLSDLFSRIVGCRFVEYLTRLRLEKAYAMLTSRATIAEAAAACGFGTVSNFTRAFRRFYGIAPSVLRRSAESDD